jgi:DNA-binding MarR family transcriptional regulator
MVQEIRMSDTLDSDRIGEVIDACAENLDRLSVWERNFIESIADQYDRRHSLSDRQREILERIYVEKIP